jgi:predicted transposase/invertase (TIGR01784 family)
MELSEDECTRLLAEEREKYRRDEEARREDAYEEGEKKGEQKGEQKGRMEVARRLLLKKESVENVTELTGISLEEVKALALELPIKH